MCSVQPKMQIISVVETARVVWPATWHPPLALPPLEAFVGR